MIDSLVHSPVNLLKTSRGKALLSLVILVFCSACARIEYQSEPLDPSRTQTAIQDKNLENEAFRQYLRALGHALPAGPVQKWDLQLLTLAAFYHSPKLQVAHQELRLSRARVQTASQRINPSLNLPLEYHSDTPGGRSPWLIGSLLELVYEREGKRQARIEQARANLNAAQLHMREVAWDIRSRLYSAYLDYYALLESRRLAENRCELLRQELTVLQQRHEAGQVGRAAVVATEINWRRAELALANLEAEKDSKYRVLIDLTGLQVDDFSNIEFEFSALRDISLLRSMDRDDFRKDALLERADIRRSLAEYQALENALRLEIEKQYPDITLSPGFIFDQDDQIWALSSSWMLPMYHNNDGPIAEALARRRIMQSRFLALQTGILNSLDAALTRFESLKKNLELAGSLRDKAKERITAVRNQYEAGYSDRLEVINSELTLLDSRRSLLDSKVLFLESAISLESVTQTPFQTKLDIEEILRILNDQEAFSEFDA